MRHAATFLLLLSLATPAAARQDPAPEPLDATKMGVSLARIQKGLRTQPGTETHDGTTLRLQFQVQVFGASPAIDVFKGFDLLHGDVPGTAPSHQQMIAFWTPKAFSSPTAPILAMALWASQQLWKKTKKTACEEDVASYRSLVMQGVSVSAPRCTQ